jgi:hypothetical protein
MAKKRRLALRGTAVSLFALMALALTWIAPTSITYAQSANHAITTSSDVGFPAIDPDYLYNQLATMATTYQAREAGYDTAQSSPTAGHDGFATYWQAEMLRNLSGFGATARRDPFSIPGWQGRPATSQAFNVEVSVPGVTHPEQVVVIGCHYDGEASSTQSANDDASGCAIELAVAHALGLYWTAHHLYPARTLRFVIFDAEEQGLYGSFHYVNQTINGDLGNVVTMINEEQNGIGYPLRFLGKLSNPTLPTTIFVTPLTDNEVYQDTGGFSPGQVQNIQRFRSLEQGAAPAAFAAFRALGYTNLTYRNDKNQPVTQPIFTQSDLRYLTQQDDTIASSDQYPFSLSGIPTATYIGNYSYYDRNPPPWSYPYDQPQDTIQLMNIYASGSDAPAQALKLSLALPGMLTAWTLAQPQVLGFVAPPSGPVASIGDIGMTAPGQDVELTAEGGFDPAHPGAPISYTWNFGDGGSASGGKVNHTWNAVGDYQLRLTVSDKAGSQVIVKTIHVTTTPQSIANPYTKYPQNGVPPANPAVTLPTAAENGGSQNGQGSSQTQPGGVGAPVWPWLLVIVVALTAIGLGLWLRQPSQSSVSDTSYGMSAEDIEARKRREQALGELTRRRNGPEE